MMKLLVGTWLEQLEATFGPAGNPTTTTTTAYLGRMAPDQRQGLREPKRETAESPADDEVRAESAPL